MADKQLSVGNADKQLGMGMAVKQPSVGMADRGRERERQGGRAL